MKRGLIDAELSAKFIDLDRASGAQNQSIAAALAPLRETLAGFKGQPLSGKLKLSIAQLVAGGGNVRELAALFSLHDGAIAPERFEARLPGRGSINVKGKPSPDGNFKGQWTVSAEEPAALAEWTGLLPPDAVGGGAFKLEGGVSLAGGRMTLDPFLVSLGETKLGGNLVYEPGAAGRPANLEYKTQRQFGRCRAACADAAKNARTRESSRHERVARRAGAAHPQPDRAAVECRSLPQGGCAVSRPSFDRGSWRLERRRAWRDRFLSRTPEGTDRIHCRCKQSVWAE